MPRFWLTDLRSNQNQKQTNKKPPRLSVRHDHSRASPGRAEDHDVEASGRRRDPRNRKLRRGQRGTRNKRRKLGEGFTGLRNRKPKFGRDSGEHGGKQARVGTHKLENGSEILSKLGKHWHTTAGYKTNMTVTRRTNWRVPDSNTNQMSLVYEGQNDNQMDLWGDYNPN